MKKISEIIKSATIMNKKLDNFQRLVKTLNLNSQKNLCDIDNIKEQIILSSILTPQSKSIIHQKLIEQKFNLTKVSAKLEMGDGVGLDNKFNKHFIRWVKNYRDTKKEELFFN